MPKLSPRYRIQFRRRREGKTDYRKRLKLLSSGKPRLVLRRSLRYITAQIVSYDPKGDKTLLAVNSAVLKKLGWNHSCKNTQAAYLTGLLIGRKALEKGVKEAVLDLGLYPSVRGSRFYAAVKGALEAGLRIPCSEDVLPSEERILGKYKDDVLNIKNIILGEKNA